MTYESVIATRRGGPETMKIIENKLVPPAENQVRVRVLASCVTMPDVQARYGHSPFKIKPPFVPGYAIVGEVDACGAGVTTAAVGDRVGALTVQGGYTEVFYIEENQIIPMPADLNPAELITLILNYLVAYQTMHRSAKVQTGETAVIIGASGGIGTAYLQLGKLVGLEMYGLASKSKHAVMDAYGAIPIDYHTQDFAEVIRHAEPEGVDVVFDGVGGDYYRRGASLLKKGGRWISYGNPMSISGLLRVLGRTLISFLRLNDRKHIPYGTGLSRFNRDPYFEDWATLCKLLRERKIQPVIGARFPILEAARANALLESGTIIGNVVLLAPELLKAKIPYQEVQS